MVASTRRTDGVSAIKPGYCTALVNNNDAFESVSDAALSPPLVLPRQLVAVGRELTVDHAQTGIELALTITGYEAGLLHAE